MRRRRIPLGVMVLGATLAVPSMAAAEGFSPPERQRLRVYAVDTWRSMAAMVGPSGLPADSLQRTPDGAWAPVSYTSPTDIASYLWDILAAESLKIVAPDEAGARIARTLSALESMDRYDGFYFNWYDHATAAPLATWPGKTGPLRPFLSSVDNGWLAASLMMVGQARPEFAARVNHLLGPMNFARFYDAYDASDPDLHPGLFRVGYWPDTGDRTPAHYGLLNTEARIISYVGISLGQVPPEHYYRLRRTLPVEQSWQQQKPSGPVRDVMGVPVFEGHYQYHGLRLVPSWGGSMFEALMVTLFVPEDDWAPESWGINHPLYVKAQIEYGRQDAGLSVWGFSPSSRPGGGYQEYGVPALGTRSGGYPARDPGNVSAGIAPGYVVTPHASFLSLPYAPAESLANLGTLADKFPAYSPFGFYDSVNVSTGQVAGSVLALDQGMILAAIANALDDRVMQHHFSSGAVEAAIRPLIAPERFSAGIDSPTHSPATLAPTIATAPAPLAIPSRSAGQ